MQQYQYKPRYVVVISTLTILGKIKFGYDCYADHATVYMKSGFDELPANYSLTIGYRPCVFSNVFSANFTYEECDVPALNPVKFLEQFIVIIFLTKILPYVNFDTGRNSFLMICE